MGGGCRYQEGAMYLLPIGIIDVADSLAALKRHIYEEGTLGQQELMETLRTNFQEKDDLRRLLLSAQSMVMATNTLTASLPIYMTGCVRY